MRGRVRIGVVVLGLLATAILAIFHGWLFWMQATSGRLLEPATTTRWILAALVLAGLLALRRVGRPLLWGRKALVLWLLVVLIHCHTFVTARGLDVSSLPASVTAVMAQLASVTGGVLAGFGLLLGLARRRTLCPRPRPIYSPRRPILRLALCGDAFRDSPRPPPLRPHTA